MYSSWCCQIFLLVVMMFFLAQPCFSDDTKELMDKICRQTTDYVFCMNTFNSHPGRDILGLSHIAISQSLIHASTTQNVIRRLINNEPDKRVKDLYRICEEAYAVIMDQFELADLAFGKMDYANVAFCVSKTPRPENDCEKNVKHPQLNWRNKQMKVLIDMSIVSVGLIGKTKA